MTATEKQTLLPSFDDTERSSYQNGTREENENEEAADYHPKAKDLRPTELVCFGGAALFVVVAAVIVLPLAATAITNGGSNQDAAVASLTATESNLPILGRSSKKQKKAEKADKANECESDSRYSKHTVKTAFELPFSALFRDIKGQKKFEASSVTIVGNEVYSVCDSSFAIAKFDSSLQPFSPGNVQIGSPDRDGDVESGYEAIFHHDGSFFVVRESVLHHNHDDDEVDGEEEDDEVDGEEEDAVVDDKHSYHAVIEELSLDDTDYTVISECSSEFEFEGNSKGFEGAVGFADASGELYIIGLCEGNHCSETRKADAGNGRLVIMKKKIGDDVDGGCLWETLRTVKIPKSAYFIDYSAIDITDDGRVAISSQENSSVWLGQVVGIDNGIIDVDAFAFEKEAGKTLQFPKSSECHTIYCNIEGIHFMNNEMLMAVSDKMKGRGKQDFRCFDKDQSIHAFVLP